MNEALAAAVEAIAPRFRSGNRIPVDKAQVPAEEWHALVAALASAPAATQGEAVLYVSPEQLAAHMDYAHGHGDHARYLPARKTPAGKFTQPLYTTPQATAPARAATRQEADVFDSAIRRSGKLVSKAEATQPAAAERADNLLVRIAEAYGAATVGHWEKGKTTHHTVIKCGARPDYHIAEFRHADDAAFCDTMHELAPAIIERLQATPPSQAPAGVEAAQQGQVALEWCVHCGEGTTGFCRSRCDNRACPKGLPRPARKSHPQEGRMP